MRPVCASSPRLSATRLSSARQAVGDGGRGEGNHFAMVMAMATVSGAGLCTQADLPVGDHGVMPPGMGLRYRDNGAGSGGDALHKARLSEARLSGPGILRWRENYEEKWRG